MYVTIDVDDIDKIYKDIKKKGVLIEIDIQDEPWGDRHFAIVDPNGIGIDIVKYSPQDYTSSDRSEYRCLDGNDIFVLKNI